MSAIDEMFEQLAYKKESHKQIITIKQKLQFHQTHLLYWSFYSYSVNGCILTAMYNNNRRYNTIVP